MESGIVNSNAVDLENAMWCFIIRNDKKKFDMSSKSEHNII